MAVETHGGVTGEAFAAFVALPENSERRFELVGGEIVEVPSNPYASMIAARIITYLGMYLLMHDIGHVTGEGGGYWVDGELFAPDVAFTTYARQRELARSGFSPQPPDLAVEVISDPTNSHEQAVLRRKLGSYLAAGCMVWIVDPVAQTVEVHTPGKPSTVVAVNGTLSAETLLPGFGLAVADVFRGRAADADAARA